MSISNLVSRRVLISISNGSFTRGITRGVTTVVTTGVTTGVTREITRIDLARRNFSSKKPGSPVEEALREAKDQAILETMQSPIKKLEIVKKPLWNRIKEELSHYWHGFKLLGAETSISSRLLVKLLKGNKLTRRETRQLRRTTSDLLRLVPFVIIVIIPFLEFALPFLLRLFPNMLPKKRKKLLRIRVEMARFLQETVGEVAISGTSKADAAKEFTEFFNKCRISGEPASTDDVLRVARKFQDELTLNNLSRPQLVSMAKYMNLNAFGTDSFLRHQIESRLVYLHADDKMIAQEGVDSLDLAELQYACLQRGIRTVGASPARMRFELSQWLDLHLVHKVPSSLLLLSHAFQTTDRIISASDEALKTKAEALQATLSALPHQAVNEAQLKISEAEGKATYKQKLDVLKEQEEMIADELEQDNMQESIKKDEEDRRKLDEIRKKEEQAPLTNEESTITTPQADGVSLSSQINAIIEATAPDNALASKMIEMVEKQCEDVEGTLTDEQLKSLADVLKTITKESAVDDVKKFVQDLKEERQEFKEDIEELKQVTQREPVKASDRLGSRVDKMIAGIEYELQKYDSEIGSKLNLVQTNELGQISINDLENALKIIRDRPNDERIKKIVSKLDGDNDGLVTLNEILGLVPDKEGHGKVLESKDKPEKA